MAEKLSYYGSVLRYIILANGKEMSEYQFPILKMEIHKEMFKVPYAFLEIKDGGRGEKDTFDAGESENFTIGSEITIKLGDADKQEQVFKGVITKQAFKVRKGASYLQLECKDKTFKMTYGKTYDVIKEKKDSDIIGDILSKRYSDIEKEVASFGAERLSFSFSEASDWDTVMMLADSNGKVAIIDDGKITVKDFEMKAPKYNISFEHDIIDMTLDADIKRYAAEVEARASDSKEQKHEDSSATPKNFKFGGDNFKPQESFEKVFGKTKRKVYTPQKTPKESTEIAKALHVKAQLAQFQGSIKIRGNNQLKVGDTIEVKGLNKTFTGTHFISGITHTMEEKDWKTELHIGLSEKWYLDDKPAMSNKNNSTGGLHIPIKGLHNAKVVSIHNDKNGFYRVEVHILHLQEANQTIWARPAQFYAFENVGSFFMPEVGSEVIVGFINEDPEQAVILGCLYNESTHAGGYVPDEDNSKKAILTKSEMKIEFNDKEKIFQIHTKNGNEITIKDEEDEETILIKDKHGNLIQTGKSKISVKAVEDFELEAKNILFKAEEKLTINAKGNDAIVVTDKIEQKAKGSKMVVDATSEFTASAILKLKGSQTHIG
ncbi:MAG: phage baseplate assembly protein V [Raineya sp.]|jgi:Rhs element Vgr protein|nr:phage baseplate assembly protein V [Raineya sp.]